MSHEQMVNPLEVSRGPSYGQTDRMVRHNRAGVTLSSYAYRKDTVDHPSAADLMRVELLSGLSDESLTALARQFDVEDYPAGHHLIGEGRSGYAFYILAQGHALVTHDGAELRTLAPGDYFGEIAILGEGRRTATVTAMEPVVVWTLFGTAFRVLQVSHPEVADALETAMRERLAST